MNNSVLWRNIHEVTVRKGETEIFVRTSARQKVCFNDKTLYMGLRPVSGILSPLREKFQF